MLSTADALATLLAAARRVDGVETVDTFDAPGRVLATAVVSPLDVLPLDVLQIGPVPRDGGLNQRHVSILAELEGHCEKVLEGVPDEQRYKILRGNAIRMLELDRV